MWMFLLGLIIGILIMVLWFSYSQKRVDSSQLEKPKKDFSSPMLNQSANSHATADHRHDTLQPQAVRKSSSSHSDNDSDTRPQNAETASNTLSEAPESSAHSTTDTTAYAASTSDTADNQAVKVDNLGDHNADDDTQSVDIEALMADLPKAETDADDLKQIKGVGPKLESMLNDLGISTFKQVASLNDRQCKEVSLAIKTFPDRIYRDQWVEQAKQLHNEKYS